MKKTYPISIKISKNSNEIKIYKTPGKIYNIFVKFAEYITNRKTCILGLTQPDIISTLQFLYHFDIINKQNIDTIKQIVEAKKELD